MEIHEVHPVTFCKATEGICRYSSSLSLTLALDGGEWLMPCSSRSTPGIDMVPIV